jgi:hypothetical protein
MTLIRSGIRRKPSVLGQFIAVKAKVCQNCKCKFTPDLPGAIACSEDCAIAHAVSVNGKARKVAAVKAAKAAAVERKADRVKRKAQKSLGKLIAEAQTAFNTFIRARDQLAGHTCISSSKPLDWTGNAVDAGHYRSRGSAPHLRFDERNCHAQSKQENRYASGNATGYRLGLIARIGLEAVEALEADQAPRKHTRDELIALRATYAVKARQLLKAML